AGLGLLPPGGGLPDAPFVRPVVTSRPRLPAAVRAAARDRVVLEYARTRVVPPRRRAERGRDGVLRVAGDRLRRPPPRRLTGPGPRARLILVRPAAAPDAARVQLAGLPRRGPVRRAPGRPALALSEYMPGAHWGGPRTAPVRVLAVSSRSPWASCARRPSASPSVASGASPWRSP